MADSKVSGSDVAAFADKQHSLATHGMALRVKYRRVDADGKPIKKKIGLSTAGTHPKNRGGLYPSGRRCKALAVDVVGKVGFLKECVCNPLRGAETRGVRNKGVPKTKCYQMLRFGR
jgi:hypothetical protein